MAQAKRKKAKNGTGKRTFRTIGGGVAELVPAGNGKFEILYNGCETVGTFTYRQAVSAAKSYVGLK